MDILVDNGILTEILIDFEYDDFTENWKKNDEWCISGKVYKTEFNLPTYDILENEVAVIYDGQYFIVKTCEPKGEGDFVYKEFTATHIMFEVKFHIVHNKLTKRFGINEILDFTLKGNKHGYSYEVIGDFEKDRVDVENFGDGANALEMLRSITQKFKAVLLADNKHLTIIKEDNWGSVTDKVYRYKYNTDQVMCTIDSTELRTKVKVSGKQKDEEEGGGWYFEPFYLITDKTELLDRFTSEREQSPISDERFTDALSAKEYAKTVLHDYYDISLSIRNLDKDIEAGEQRIFIYEPLGIKTEVKTIGYTKYPYSLSKKPDVILSNEVKDMISIQSQLLNSSRSFQNIIINNGKNFILNNMPQWVSNIVNMTIPNINKEIDGVLKKSETDKQELEEKIETTKSEIEQEMANQVIKWDEDFDAARDEITTEINQSHDNAIQAGKDFTNSIKHELDGELNVIEQKQGQIQQELTSTTQTANTAVAKANEAADKVDSTNIVVSGLKDDVFGLVGKVEKNTTQLGIVDNTIKGLVTTTDGHTTDIGSLQLTSDRFGVTLGKVEADLEAYDSETRNFILKSDVTLSYPTLTNAGSYSASTNGVSPDVFKLLAGKIVVVSVDVRVKNAKPRTSGVSRIGFEMTLGTAYVGAWRSFSTGESFEGRIWAAVQLPAVIAAQSLGGVYIQVNGEDLYVGHPKISVQSTNKNRTVWSLAPEDVVGQIQFSAIEQTVKGIQTTVAGKADESKVIQLENQLTSTVEKLDIAGSVNMFSVVSFKETHFLESKWNMPTLTILLKPNTTYTISTDFPGSPSTQSDVFAAVSPIIPSGVNNGLSNGYPRVVTTTSTGKLDVSIRTDQMLQYLVGGSKHIQVEEGKVATPWKPNVNDGANRSQLTQLATDINLRVELNDVVNQINVGTEVILIAGKKIQLDGDVTMTDAYINKLYVNSLFVSKFSAQSMDVVNANIGTIRAGILVVDSVTATSLKVDQALIDKLMVNSLLVNKLYADTAFITKFNAQTVTAIDVNATTIRTKLLIANVITANMLQASEALFDKVFSNDAYFKKLVANQAFFDALQVKTFTGATIVSPFSKPWGDGLLSSGNMYLTDGHLYSDLVVSDEKQWVTFDVSPYGIDYRSFVDNQEVVWNVGANGYYMKKGQETVVLNSNELTLVKPDGSYSRLTEGEFQCTYRVALKVNKQKTDGTFDNKLLFGAFYEGTVASPDLFNKSYARLGMEGNNIYDVGSFQFKNSGNAGMALANVKPVIAGPTGSALSIGTIVSATAIIEATRYNNQNYADIRAPLNMNGNAITNQSDIRLKTNIEASKLDAVAEIKKLTFVEFDWDLTHPNNKLKPTERQLGLIAQYSRALRVVGQPGRDFEGVDMSKQINLNTMAIQQLINRMETIEQTK